MELEFNDHEIKKVTKDPLGDAVATAVADGKAVSWMQRRMESGARALVDGVSLLILVPQ